MGLREKLTSFFRTRLGRIVLLIIAILIVSTTYVYAGGALIALLAILLFGLAVPIWFGVKRPRTLAIFGIAILVVSPAIITALEVPILLQPVGPAGSTDLVLQNASVSPFNAAAGSTFEWTVSVVPANLPAGHHSPANITLYVSTCPGATANYSTGSPCNAGYPFYSLLHTFPANTTKPQLLTFNETLPGVAIWDWQMGLAYVNATGSLTYVFLQGDPTYNGIEGPVTGDYGGVYVLIVSSFYLTVLVYLGIVFFVALLIYMVFKGRQQKKADAAARAAAPPPEGAEGAPRAPARKSSAPLPGGGASGSRPPPSRELACPNCQAVIYANETFCWKCGAALPGAPGGGKSSPKG